MIILIVVGVLSFIVLVGVICCWLFKEKIRNREIIRSIRSCIRKDYATVAAQGEDADPNAYEACNPSHATNEKDTDGRSKGMAQVNESL